MIAGQGRQPVLVDWRTVSRTAPTSRRGCSVVHPGRAGWFMLLRERLLAWKRSCLKKRCGWSPAPPQARSERRYCAIFTSTNSFLHYVLDNPK